MGEALDGDGNGGDVPHGPSLLMQLRLYNAIALKEDCVLLPRSQRRKTFWRVPRKKKGVAFGFGQSNVWFARGEDDNKYLSDFLDRLENQIETYDGENWIDRYAE